MINEALLLEKKLTTDFTFGFELEAVANGRYDFDESNEIKDFIDSYIGTGGNYHGDGSIEYDEDAVGYYCDSDGDESYEYQGEEVTLAELENMGFDIDDLDSIKFQTAFEYSSPILKFNVENIQKIVNMLNEGFKQGLFKTNDSCGFHHHLSYEGISGEDAAWIVSQLATDQEARKLFKEFKTTSSDGGELNYNFISQWSSDGYLYDLNSAIRVFDFNDIIKLLNTEKYSVLNVHANKTLEWRGPRDFLQSEDKKIIINFYKHLWKVVNWMTVALDKKEINGMNKDIYLKNLIIGNNIKPIENFPAFNTDKNELSQEEIVNLVDKIKNQNKVGILINLAKNKRKLDQVIQRLFNGNGLGRKIDMLIETYPIYPQVINNIAYKYIPAKMYKLADSTAIYNTSERTLGRLLDTRYGIDTNEASLEDRIIYLVPYMNPELFNTEDNFLNVRKVIRKSNYNNSIIKYMLDINSDENIINDIISYYLIHVKDGSIKNIDLDIFDNLSKNKKQEIINNLIPFVYKFPQLIKYIDNLSKESILSLIGYSMRIGNYGEVKNMLLSSNKISKKDLQQLENKFTEYYKHDFYDEFELEQ